MREHCGIAIFVSVVALIASTSMCDGGFLKIKGNKLFLDGVEYRAIGANVPHLSQGYMGTWFHWKQIYGTREKMKQSIVDAIIDASNHKLAFFRFFASPGYPKDTAELYLKNPDEYWRLMDELFALCRKYSIKLIPSLGVLYKWDMDCGELRTAVLEPNSKTYEATRKYVREFVTRYKDDATVLMWELGNEYFLTADVNMDGWKMHGKGVYPDGTTEVREKYSLQDSFTFDMLLKFYKEITAYIKGLDPNHPVVSGDSGVREESTSRRQTFPDFKYRWDSIEEHLSNLLESQESLDIFSVHKYGNFTTGSKVSDLSYLDLLRCQVRAIHALPKPLFVGEFGQSKPYFRDDTEAVWARAAIDLLDEEGVALIALWVWHFPWQDKDFNIPNGAAQPLLMERVRAFNEKYAGLRKGKADH